MQPIHVKRFPDNTGTVEPDDRSWHLRVDADGTPHLFVRVNVRDDGGALTHGYIDVRYIPPELSVADMKEGEFCGEVPAEEIDPADFPDVEFPPDHPGGKPKAPPAGEG